MCRESVTIALCAHEAVPYLSFTCAKLHLVAGKREVCENIVGACDCFFGSCGSIEKTTPTAGINFSEVKKVRCLTCTAREDDVGDRRTSQQLVESPLLARKPVTSLSGMKEFRDILKTLWNGEKTCPFHAAVEEDESDNDARPTTQGETSPAADRCTEKDSKDMTNDTVLSPKTSSTTLHSHDSSKRAPTSSPAKSGSVSPRNGSTKDDSQDGLNDQSQRRDEDPDNFSPGNGLKLDVGLAVSRWAKAETTENTNPMTLTSRQNVCPKTTHNGHNMAKRDRVAGSIKLPQLALAKEFLKGNRGIVGNTVQ